MNLEFFFREERGRTSNLLVISMFFPLSKLESVVIEIQIALILYQILCKCQYL